MTIVKSVRPPLGDRWKLDGVDMSHHQQPSQVNYATLPPVAIFRATYGTMQDRAVTEHWRRARALAPAGTKLGLYHFFRPSQGIDEQFRAFCGVSDLVGHTLGDVAPALDLEFDPFAPGDATPESWHKRALFEAAEELAQRLGDLFGTCILYGGAQWLRSFCGAWTDKFPIWTAEYRGKLNTLGPRTLPGQNVVAWQYEGRAAHNYHLPGVFRGQALDVNVWSDVPLYER